MSEGKKNSEPLSGLAPGDRARIVAVEVADVNRGRILEMGFTVGATIEVVRFAPLGDPMELRVRGAHVSIRKAEAAGVRVQRI
jgi:Fe2+ transport system protein FeoA